jgi:hypothetical protein
VSRGSGNSSWNPPEGAIDRNDEKTKMGDASRASVRPGIEKKEGLIQGGNRVYKGSRTKGFLSFLSWPSFFSIPGVG